MEKYLWIGFIGAVIALLFAVIQRKKVMSYSEGNATMQKIAKSIREGANAYLKHQYSTVAKVFAVVFVILAIIAFASGGSMLSKFTPFAFLTGGIWSMLAGLIGMKIATNANARTAQAASEGLNRGLRVAFSSGSVMGFTVVGLGMLDISLWLVGLYFLAGITDPVELGNIMVMNGIGASFMALFARVGGGIYTKAADVGADLVGKVEAGIPEDDPHARHSTARLAGTLGERQATERIHVGPIKGELPQLAEIDTRCRRIPALGIRKGKLDGNAHVRGTEMSHHRAIGELDHRVNLRLALHDHINKVEVAAEQMHGLDTLQTLVHKSGRVDGDLSPHGPRGMCQGIVTGHAV